MAKSAATKTPVKGKAPAPPPKTAAKGAAAKGAATKGATTKAPAKGGKAAPAPAKPATPTTVTLKQMAASFAERHDMAKRDADILLNDVFTTVVDHLKAGVRVRIGGLGIIEVKNRPARMGRNPATGEAIQIKASRKIAFRAAKELKDAI